MRAKITPRLRTFLWLTGAVLVAVGYWGIFTVIKAALTSW